MAVRKPENWTWSHDIKPHQIESVVLPGNRLMRLSSYGEGDRRRFAALVYPGAGRSYQLDLDAAALQALDGRAVAITASTDAKFSVVLEQGPGAVTAVHVDLEAEALQQLADPQHAILDVATYVVAGQRRFVAIVEDRAAESTVLVGVTAAEIDAQVVKAGATLTRVRAYTEGGATKFVAIAERVKQAGWAWYADLDGDGVARQLENNAAYPVDLDATRGDRGVRFTVVMYK
jgi:hypothetical protein